MHHATGQTRTEHLKADHAVGLHCTMRQVQETVLVSMRLWREKVLKLHLLWCRQTVYASWSYIIVLFTIVLF